MKGFMMKQLITKFFITLFVLLLFFNYSYANNRKLFEGNQKFIKTKYYGKIYIINWGVLSDTSDTLLLDLIIPENVDTSKHSERTMIKDAINFFYQFLKQYKIGNVNKKYIGFGVCQLGHGYVYDNVYRISVKNLKKLNNRDFGTKDLDNMDKKSVTVIPVKEIFKHMEILNVEGIPKNLKPSNIKVDDKATNVLLDCLVDYKFDNGIIQGFVEAAYERKHKSSVKSSSVGKSSSTSKNCERISNYIVRQACRGDCGAIESYNIRKACQGDCSVISAYSLRRACQGDCSAIEDYSSRKACESCGGGNFWTTMKMLGYSYTCK